MSREEVLAGLDAAKATFVDALTAVPPAALSFRKAGDDYSLGGLVAHNTGVVQHYRLVLAAVVASGFTPVRPQDPAGFWEGVGARSGRPLGTDEAPAALAELAEEHGAFVAELAAVADDDWERQGPVIYGDAVEPLGTSAPDIAGWVRDHYLEHVAHIEDLHAAWREADTLGS